MQKFIIGYGIDARVDMIDALDLEAARAEATRRSAADKIDDPDWSWAVIYDDLRAYELGLIDPPTQRDVWRSQAPWR